ncbi:MAG: hypothetical protein ABI665_23645 [Vicinamibacterales bacterium]
MRSVRQSPLVPLFAMLLLLWTAADLSNMSLCALEREGTNAVPLTASAVLVDTATTPKPVPPAPHIDDCFCCSHCVEVATLIPATVSMAVDVRIAHADVFLPRIFGSLLYHPPLA